MNAMRTAGTLSIGTNGTFITRIRPRTPMGEHRAGPGSELPNRPEGVFYFDMRKKNAKLEDNTLLLFS
jgi:hypothetical protein